mgnify:CR=1 FL=1
MNVVIVIPAFNESASVGRVVRAVARHGSIVVVDDGSTDDTVAAARDAGAVVVQHGSNRGYDQALQTGFEQADRMDAEVVVTFDADGQHDAAVLERFTGPIASGRAELVLGVRPRGARWAEVLFSGYTRWRFGVPDILCGLKGYHMSLYRAHGRFDGTNSVGTELALAGLHGGARTFLTPIPIAPRTGVPRFGRAWRANIRILRAMLAALRMDLRSMLHSGNHEIIPPKWQT